MYMLPQRAYKPLIPHNRKILRDLILVVRINFKMLEGTCKINTIHVPVEKNVCTCTWKLLAQPQKCKLRFKLHLITEVQSLENFPTTVILLSTLSYG